MVAGVDGRVAVHHFVAGEDADGLGVAGLALVLRRRRRWHGGGGRPPVADDAAHLGRRRRAGQQEQQRRQDLDWRPHLHDLLVRSLVYCRNGWWQDPLPWRGFGRVSQMLLVWHGNRQTSSPWRRRGS